MQTGGGCRNRTLPFRPYGLVILVIARIGRTQRRDIGRQGHRPDLVQCRVKGIALGIKGQTQPAIGDLDHPCRKLIAKADDLAFAQFAKGFGKRVPSTGGRFQQCDLDPGNRIPLWRHAGPGACQPCRNDLGVIEHQQIARLQDLGQITDMAVTNLLPWASSRRAELRGRAGRVAIRDSGR